MQQGTIDPSSLRSLGDRTVRIRLNDGTEFTGTLRTELLTDNSISVFLDHAHAAPGSEGVTIYLDSIAEIAPVS